MQLFVHAGVPLGTLAVDVLPRETVLDLKMKLGRCSRRLSDPAGMTLQYAGRVLDDSTALGEVANLQAWSTLTLSHRLRGGGGDGGSTGAESRSSYLEMYAEKKADKVNPAEELLARWTTCHLSNEPLRLPCVIDELGFVYNKEAVIAALLGKAIPAALSYISGLKHVMELKLHAHESSVASKLGAGASKKPVDQGSFQPSNSSSFSCPLTGQEFNGRFKFVAIRPSGLVVSEKALKEAKAAVEELVGSKWSEDDVVPINPTGDTLDALKAKVGVRLAAEREKKLAKKAKNGAAAAAGADGVAAAGTDGAGRKREASPPSTMERDREQAEKALKKMKAPVGANEALYKSLFCTGKEQLNENFMARALSARGMKM